MKAKRSEQIQQMARIVWGIRGDESNAELEAMARAQQKDCPGARLQDIFDTLSNLRDAWANPWRYDK